MAKRKKRRERTRKERLVLHDKQLMPSSTIVRPEYNSREQLIVVPMFAAGTPESLVERPPTGVRGNYTIKFILTTPGKETFRTELDMDNILRSGDSLLMPPPGVTALDLDLYNETGTDKFAHIKFDVGRARTLSSAVIGVYADNFHDAQRIAHDIVQAFLSWLSYIYDVALDVAGYESVQEETQIRRYEFGLLGKMKSMDPQKHSSLSMSKPEYRLLLSAYREGLNATNVFYQLLCFYKVSEGVDKLRNKRKVAVVSSGGKWRDFPERIPDTPNNLPPMSPWVLDMFRPYFGKKFKDVVDDFRAICRNAVAHLNPDQSVLIADRYDDIVICERAVPVLKYICREKLRNELSADGQYDVTVIE